MSSEDIINNISTFDPDQTVFLDYSNITVNGSLNLNARIAKDRNTIILLGGSVMGEINLNLSSVPSLDAEEEQEYLPKYLSESEEIYMVSTGITKTIGLLKNSGLNGSLVLYYPMLSGSQIDPRLTITSDESTTLIKSYNINDIATPCGRNMILIFTKTTSSQNLIVNISRPSYKSQICDPCPSCTNNTNKYVTYNSSDAHPGVFNKTVFISVVVGMAVYILFLFFVIYLIFTHMDNESNDAAATGD